MEKKKNLFKDLQNRIQSMALSHEMLYQTDDLQRINYEDYIRKLISGLVNSIKVTENMVDIDLNIKDVYLNIDTATPLGLNINEVVTNSLKYAFKNKGGTISVNIKKLDYPYFVLEIGDNGIGFTENQPLEKPHSLGLTLIQKLTLQLKGTISRDHSKTGTNYLIKFQEISTTK